MKYTIPEMTFEDQIYSLFSYSKPPVIKVTDLNKIYKIQLDNSKLSKDDLIELWRKVEGEI